MSVLLKEFPNSIKSFFLKKTNSLIEVLDPYWKCEKFDGDIKHVTKWYMPDTFTRYIKDTNKSYTSDDIIYEINENGFRVSSNFPYNNSNKIIACFGCSHTFGIGLPWDEIWHHKLSEYLNFEYTVKNYGFGGASNDMISRLIYNFTLNNKPDIICCFFTDITRMEIINEYDGVLLNFLDSLISNLGEIKNDTEKRELFETYNAYKKISTEKNSIYNFYKNLKFIEKICESNNIIFYWSTWSESILSFKSSDMQKIFNKSFINIDLSDVLNADSARDKIHYGKNFHKKLAEKFYNKIINDKNILQNN